MFKVGEWTVKFLHPKLDDETTERITICNIFSPSALFTGLAYCSRLDQFSKAKGRKLSLARALQAFTKPERLQFWLAYKASGAKGSDKIQENPKHA